MPVNTAALKTFAPAMRRQLIEAVGRKLDRLLTSQTPDTLTTYASQIAELREQEQENREQLLERVAYTWFNRLSALRYLDARGWHPFGAKVLMPATEAETQPELLKLIRAGSLPAELKAHTNESRLHGLLDGQIPTAIAGADPEGEVYRELVLATCRFYHELLPNLFERLDDATELLLPDDLITETSVADKFRCSISDDDCQDVEIIGWLYQFYISEKKALVIGKVEKSEDIPAATQLFTPNWIVKYMVQNTLGAQWLGTYPDSAIKPQMEYYIEPAEQTEEVKAQLAANTPSVLNPEELTLIDPACGSGHILVEAYELFKAIYLERGYQLREIPQLIFENNLFGLDIDERAAQLTSLALMMKGRADDRRLFERGVKLNVMALVDSAGFDAAGLANALDLSDYGLKLTDLTELKRLFQHAKTFGSLIQVPERLAKRLPELKRLSVATSQDLFASEGPKHLTPLVEQAELLAAHYYAVVANPPYMGARQMPPILGAYAKQEFPLGYGNLANCFITRCIAFLNNNGACGMVTPEAWMFLGTFYNFREALLKNASIKTMAHIGFGGFEQGFGTTAFTATKWNKCNPESVFIDLRPADEQEDKSKILRERKNIHVLESSTFLSLPGFSIAYWISDSAIRALRDSENLGELASPRQGLATGDNEKFVRQWFEVSFSSICFNARSLDSWFQQERRWAPYSKGGAPRKWYGNGEHIIAFNPMDFSQLSNQGNKLPSKQFYFKEAINWSLIGSTFAARFRPLGFVFDVNGMSSFTGSTLNNLLGLVNSKVGRYFLEIINPTLAFQVGDLKRFPCIGIDDSDCSSEVTEAIGISKEDWDSKETSWDFSSYPLLGSAIESSSDEFLQNTEGISSLEALYVTNYLKHQKRREKLKNIETKINLKWIERYRLSDVLSPLVEDSDITLSTLDRDQLIKEVISYALGCIMGRYSLNEPGLILADSRDNQEAHLAAFEKSVGKLLTDLQFKPDTDAIIPVLDGEWFEDDMIARIHEFLRVAFPESSLGDTLRFLETSLGKDIRKYFTTDFYKDHLQTYKKRPIYWLVQSPKKSFACLIYLHRYTKDTLNLVLNNYLRPYIQKLEARLAQLGLDQLNDDLPAKDQATARKEGDKISKALRECQDWEREALLPLAQQRIELDLDDGVKVNYLKLQAVLAPIPGLAAKED